MAPFIVLDQNALRKPAFLEPAVEQARRTHAQLLILDIAVLEMTKHPSMWEQTTRHSLASILKFRELVVIGRGVPDLMRDERATGIAALGAIADLERTPPFRDLVVELQNPAGGPHLNYMRSRMADTQTRITEPQYLRHAENKKTLLGFRDIWTYILPNRADRKRVRDNRDDQVRLLAHPTLTRQIEHLLVADGRSPRQAQRVAFDRSISSHWTLGLLASSLRWFLDQGLDSLPALKATNEVLDADYVTVGSVCAELLTLETNVRETVALVRAAAEIRAVVYAAVDAELPDADAQTRFQRLCELTPKS